MKSLILLVVVVFTNIFLISAQSSIPLFTHSITQYAVIPSVPIANENELFNYYDSNHHLYQTKKNNWSGTDWVLNAREYYTLNAEGKAMEILEKKWDDNIGQLYNSRRTSYGYHTDGQENYRKIELWDTTTVNWRTVNIRNSSFSASNKILEFTSSFYVNGMQSSGGRNTFSYDGMDRLSETINESWKNGVWGNSQKTEYVYADSDENFDESFVRIWDETSMDWGGISTRNTQTVTTSQRVLLNEKVLAGVWVPSTKTTTNYNVFGNINDRSFENWDTTGSIWNLNTKNEYYYNNDQSLLQAKTYFRDFITGEVFLQFIIDYDYNTYAVSTQLPILQAKVSISPNPSTDVLRVEVSGEKASNISLLDMVGNVLIQTSTTANIATLSLLDHPSGTYFLQVEQAGSIKVFPVIKQ